MDNADGSLPLNTMYYSVILYAFVPCRQNGAT